MDDQESLPTTLGRGVAAGLAGTAVMTAFQLLVEMPLTRREASFAPAELAMTLLRVKPRSRKGRRQLNYATHFALGAGWGLTRAAIARTRLRGQTAAAATFGAMYPADLATATLLGVYKPKTWSRQDVAIDVVDKLVQAAATGVAFDRLGARG